MLRRFAPRNDRWLCPRNDNATVTANPASAGGSSLVIISTNNHGIASGFAFAKTSVVRDCFVGRLRRPPRKDRVGFASSFYSS
ncbi:MAG: hypothetical protein PHO48_05310 [Candidatus Gracilibacteria bacterium]|nr:hypothetical protein [Candidatus Gracilibacteria bacterium]